MYKIPPLAENTVMQGLITMNEAGTIVSATNEISEIFGYNGESLVDLSINRIIPLYLNDSIALYIKESMCKNFANRIHQFKNIKGVRKDGAAVKVNTLIGKFDADHASYLTLMVNFDDLTTGADINSEQWRASREVSENGSISSDLIHELSQPLSIMSNYTQACLNLIQNENADLIKLSDYLSRVKQQALKLGEIIHGARNQKSI